MGEAERSFLREGEVAGVPYLLGVPNQLQRGLAGTRVGRGVGSSLEFLDHREYQPGDDIRHINWQALARNDRLSIKLFREEISPHADVLFDASSSMDLPGTPKGRAAIGLTALLAKAADNAGFTCSPWRIGAGCERVWNGHLPPSAWEDIDLSHPEDGGEALARLPPTLRPHGLRVLISDLLWAADPAAILRLLSHQAAAVLVVQVLAQSELQPDFQGNIRLIDRETGREEEVFLDQAAIARYKAHLARHQDHWLLACRRVGATLVTVVAEHLVADWKPTPIVERQFLSAV